MTIAILHLGVTSSAKIKADQSLVETAGICQMLQEHFCGLALTIFVELHCGFQYCKIIENNYRFVINAMTLYSDISTFRLTLSPLSK